MLKALNFRVKSIEIRRCPCILIILYQEIKSDSRQVIIVTRKLEIITIPVSRIPFSYFPLSGYLLQELSRFLIVSLRFEISSSAIIIYKYYHTL